MELKIPHSSSSLANKAVGVNIDQLSRAELVLIISQLTKKFEQSNARVEGMLDVVSEWCQMNLKPRLKTTNQQDEIDGLAYGVNLAIEELEYKYQHEQADQNKELSNLIYRSSHNLKSPFCTMEGLLGLVDDNQPMTPDLKAHMLEVLSDSKQMLDNLQECAYAVNYKPHTDRFDISDAVNEVIREIGDSAVEVILDSQITSLQADREGFVYVLSQLVHNAAQHAYPNASGKVRIHVMPHLRHIEVDIEDYGIGIPPSVQEDIFTMFFRGDSSDGCRGLGLYSAKKMAKSMNAKLSLVSSEPGRTVFGLKLPTK